MEPIDDSQLRDLLIEWQAPAPPSSLEKRVLGGHGTWWRFLFSGTIRVPVPIVCGLAVAIAMGAWRWVEPAQQPPGRVVIKTERVEVPVVRDRVVTKIVYQKGPAAVHDLTFRELRPVGELRPRIVRSRDAKN